MGGQRPLSELGPMERRRNSPSFSQNTKARRPALPLNSRDSSPFDPSPFSSSINTTASPRHFWQGRDPTSPGRLSFENSPFSQREASPSPSKRSSIENLKRASRVKNSNMFAREHKDEYDPTRVPHVERPLANPRPLSVQVQGNAFGSRGVEGLRAQLTPKAASKIPLPNSARSSLRPSETATPSTASPSKGRISPTKSSLSSPTKFKAEPSKPASDNAEAWSEDDEIAERRLPPGRSLHRHAKSVTFDAAPPQVNEYEMRTPDLSSIGTASREGSYDSAAEDEDESFERADDRDMEDSFDASLEDTDKTPVVGPDDWRHPGSGASQDTSLLDDPFTAGGDGTIRASHRNSTAGRDSVTSNDRPLPPLPGLGLSGVDADSSRVLSSPRSLNGSPQRALPPQPGPATASSVAVQGAGGSSMCLDDKLRLMMIQDTPETQPAAGRASPRHEDHVAGLGEYKLPPRISRESILRKVKSKSQYNDELDLNFSSPAPSSSPERHAVVDLDPDTPLPSTEPPTIREETVTVTETRVETHMTIKQEEANDGEVDVYSIPDMYSPQIGSLPQVYEDSDARMDQGQPVDDDMESSYSCNSLGEKIVPPAPSVNDDGHETPRQTSPVHHDSNQDEQMETSRLSLPELASILREDSFEVGLSSFMTPSPSLAGDAPTMDSAPQQQTCAGSLSRRPITPEEQIHDSALARDESDEAERPNTPDSVIRHPLDGDEVDGGSATQEPPRPVSPPTVPDPVATIKAPGGRLKTRPSITPSDMAAMAEIRRQVSGSNAPPPSVPPIPERHRARPSTVEEAEMDDGRSLNCSMMSEATLEGSLLDMPVGSGDDDLSFGLHKEFDRLMEAKKRGYLMRQNTKVIVASSNGEAVPPVPDLKVAAARSTRSAGNSPRKASHERNQPSWSVEPWNGTTRQKSTKVGSSSPRKRPASGIVPPLPGHQSNVSGPVNGPLEDELVVEDRQEGVERGRLFVKVVGVKDIDLPLPKSERSVFNVTLDNGIHCVQTAWLELGRSAPVGQEFELVVLDELEFTLTLQTEEPKPPATPAPASPTKSTRSQKPSTFSRVFATPRKRKEMERKQQEEEQRVARLKYQAAQAKKAAMPETAWDLLHGLIDRDGSFGRSYFSLQEYEDRAYGRPITVSIPCFNEWATEDPGSGSSAKSRHGGVQRRAPYQIGTMELQLLFVPRIKGAKEEDMPKSLNGAIRDLREAEASIARLWEGHLSQQGGDCPYWRRRFFKLEGSKLTAYHESTHQPRATINLAKATKLIDDRSSLLQKEGPSKGKGRRKSAFAEEEEGYMFVEEGFRIRFANGEVIDFYADSAAEKEGWMRMLEETVGKDSAGGKSWTDAVLARERGSLRARRPNATHAQIPRFDHFSTSSDPPPTPPKGSPTHQPAGYGHHKGASMSSTPRSMII
ncbi:MAG: Bud site selection protein bud4 [Thelocarpon impressellum]|nr:MAG: Bud site selection protein bud4 [Thelocarpon impressellum]